MINLSFSYADLEYFLLILVRVTSFIFIAPFYSMNNTPGRVKIGLGIFLSFLVFTAITPHETVVYDSEIEYAALVIKEMLVGLLLGFGTNFCTTIVSFAGRIMDMEIGLAMVTLMDPTTRESSSVTGVLYQYMLMLFLIVTGMHRYLLRALADTFTLIPVSKAIFDMDSLMSSMLSFMTNYLIIGFRICLPVFTVMIMLNAILGILAKVSPQLNMFAVGIQFKILTGLAVLFLTVEMMPGAADFIFTQMKTVVVSFVEGMM